MLVNVFAYSYILPTCIPLFYSYYWVRLGLICFFWGQRLQHSFSHTSVDTDKTPTPSNFRNVFIPGIPLRSHVSTWFADIENWVTEGHREDYCNSAQVWQNKGWALYSTAGFKLMFAFQTRGNQPVAIGLTDLISKCYIHSDLEQVLRSI